MDEWNEDKDCIVTAIGVNSGMSHIIYFFNHYFLVYQLIFLLNFLKSPFLLLSSHITFCISE